MKILNIKKYKILKDEILNILKIKCEGANQVSKYYISIMSRVTITWKL